MKKQHPHTVWSSGENWRKWDDVIMPQVFKHLTNLSGVSYKRKQMRIEFLIWRSPRLKYILVGLDCSNTTMWRIHKSRIYTLNVREWHLVKWEDIMLDYLRERESASVRGLECLRKIRVDRSKWWPFCCGHILKGFKVSKADLTRDGETEICLWNTCKQTIRNTAL